MKAGVILGAACAVCLSGCTGKDDTSTGAGAAGGEPLSGEYLLDGVDGYVPVAGTTIRIEFSGNEVRFSGGCNSYDGSFSVQGGVLVVTRVGSTGMGCAPELHLQDDWLEGFLTSRPALQLDGDTLILTGEEATLVFLDREVADPDRPLTGRLWTIHSLRDGDAVSSIPMGAVATVTFHDDRTVDIESGCNSGSGSYEATDVELTFGLISYTRVACPDGGSASLESHVQGVFGSGKASYEIDAARLRVDRDSVGISATTE
jgi:heat shock protein HslJ